MKEKEKWNASAVFDGTAGWLAGCSAHLLVATQTNKKNKNKNYF